ncbi:MAG: helix-turn-helix transcriptional regulator [Bacteroidales bacterium]|nr:helix-turn-helix transcriptional regulator [Bacteroidales bacterium]
MIGSIIIFLPLFVCLFSVSVHAKLIPRTQSFAPLCLFLLAYAGFLFTDCCYADRNTSPLLLSRATLFAQFAAPCLIPLLVMYYRRTMHIGKEEHPLEMLWIIVPVSLFTAAALLYYLSGESEIIAMMQRVPRDNYAGISSYRGSTVFIYFIVTSVVFRAVMTVELLWFAGFIINLAIKQKFRLKNVYRFYFKGESIKLSGYHTLFILPMYFIILIKFLLLKQAMLSEPVYAYIFALLLTFCILGFSYVALFGARKTITRKEMKNAFRYNYSPKNKAQAVEEMLDDLLDEAEEDALRRIQEKISEDLHIEAFRSPDTPAVERNSIAEQVFSAVSDSWGEDTLLTQFQHLMRDEMLFLQPRLSLDDVADKLGTNKFYVSKMVNNAYNLGFPELINTLRVDYAEQYILNHRDAKQDEIARQCGFLSASSFNTTFKKVTGVTPKVWIASAASTRGTEDQQ